MTTLVCSNDKFGIKFWLEKDGTQKHSPFFLYNSFPFQGRQINEDDYKKKCGPGPTGDVCLAITGIARVTSSCANGTSPVGGRCSLECEQEGAELGDGNEIYGNLVCQKKGGGVSCLYWTVNYHLSYQKEHILSSQQSKHLKGQLETPCW